MLPLSDRWVPHPWQPRTPRAGARWSDNTMPLKTTSNRGARSPGPQCLTPRVLWPTMPRMVHDAHVVDTGLVGRANAHVLADAGAQNPARERWVERLHPLLGATLVFAVAMLAFVPGIGQREIWTRDEARTALVVREMLASGDWSIARMPGRVHGKKPPLYHWLTAVAARRGLDETTLRLPAAVAASGT